MRPIVTSIISGWPGKVPYGEGKAAENNSSGKDS
jgi:hypothetical protein